MVPSRTSSAVGAAAAASPSESSAASRSSTPQPSASRIQFRPVMPQRRRTPNVSTPQVKSEAEERPKPSRPPPRPTPRPPLEMTATGPFALGAAPSSSASSSRRAAALRAGTPAVMSMVTAAAAPSASGDTEARGVDIEHVHELDDMAPQSLMQAPPSIKREKPSAKPEPMDDVPDVNQSQALDLSDNEDDAEEETASFLSSSLQSGSPLGQLFLFQFPQSGLSFQRAEGSADEAPKTEDGAPAAPEGHIGHLDVYPSGRIVLRIGDMPYEVGGGSESSFLQQVMLLDTERQSAECLGELNGKVVVTPQLDYLMERARLDAAP